MEGEETVDWGVEDDVAVHDAQRQAITDGPPGASESTQNSPPRTEVDDDAISLGGEDDDTAALMNYREGMDAEKLKPLLDSGPNKHPLTTLQNGDARAPRPAKREDTDARGPIRSPLPGSPKHSSSNRLPVPPVGVGLPARPNFESSQRVRTLNHSARHPWTLSFRSVNVNEIGRKKGTVIEAETATPLLMT